MSEFANTYVDEGTVDGSHVVDFPHTSWSRAVITNDSDSEDMTFTLQAGQVATLKPEETATVSMRITDLALSGNSVPYRVWLYG